MCLNINETRVLEYLKTEEPEVLMVLLKQAEEFRLAEMGNDVYMRGLIEFSNCCTQNCFYCGLRRDNGNVNRYTLDDDTILALARQACEAGFQSVALQSGDLRDHTAVVRLAELVNRIKLIPTAQGCSSPGITLSTGELSYEEYKMLREAGADRYLLRIETSSPDLFRSLHPPEQTFERRLECLGYLKDLGYQLGTGTMIGIPGQTCEDLLSDLVFFQEWDIDMLGMGPYIIHPDTPLVRSKRLAIKDAFGTSLKMMALARLIMGDINMVCSTALQTMSPMGLRLGLRAGANVVMPILTPEEHRQDYSLYANKAFKGIDKLEAEVNEAGYRLAYWKLGNSRHYYRVRGLAYPENSPVRAANSEFVVTG